MEILYVLLVLLVVTRAFGELAQRLNQPALLGELLSGLALGLLVSRHASLFPVLSEIADDRVFHAITDLGIFFLMLLAGLELRPRDVATASRAGALVAVGGMLVPLGLGMMLGWSILPESPLKLAQALFIGVALSITAVPVSARVLMELGKLDTRVGHLIISAAVIDDVLSLLLLTALTSVLHAGGSIDPWTLLRLAGQAALFFVVTVGIAHFVLPLLATRIRVLRIDEFEFSFLLIAALGFSVLAEISGLHFVLGAFVAGLFFGRETINADVYESVRKNINSLTVGFLAPVFFASVGLRLDPGVLVAAPMLTLALVVLASFGKLGGAGLPALASGLSARGALAVGIGMNARGAVELIIADIALRGGLFSSPDPVPPVVAQLFSAVVVMAIFTTLATPIGLRWIFQDR